MVIPAQISLNGEKLFPILRVNSKDYTLNSTNKKRVKSYNMGLIIITIAQMTESLFLWDWIKTEMINRTHKCHSSKSFFLLKEFYL